MKDNAVIAAKLFREAAEAGYPEAQFQFGLCLRDGRGVSQNLPEAENWLRKAAAAGHPEAAKKISPASPSTQSSVTHPQPAKKKPGEVTGGNGSGMGCAVIAGFVAFIALSFACTSTSSGFFGPTTDTNWGGIIIGTVIATAIAYSIGKSIK